MSTAKPAEPTTPAATLEGRCRRVTRDIHGRSQKARVAACVARVHAAPDRPLRVVATEAIGGGRGVEVCYSTCADATAERTAPLALLIHSPVVIWFGREGHRHWQPAGHAWCRPRGIRPSQTCSPN